LSTPTIRITGGYPLTGTITASGAKNSVLKLMAAAILAPGSSHISNVPLISDVTLMAEVLEYLGASVVFGEHEVSIDTSGVQRHDAPYELVSRMRASTAVLGPLLGRFGQARVAMPGGCQIGARKIDQHLLGLEALGVEFETEHGYIEGTAAKGLRGATVVLDIPSVGATENLIMAAATARGTTRIENAAREPEIVDLAGFLTTMGAHIAGAGSPIVEIEGTDRLYPVAGHQTIGDRIEAGTYLAAGALLAGPLTVRGVDPAHLEAALRKLEEAGVEVSTGPCEVTVSRQRPLKPLTLQTQPHPGFPTDLQAQFMVLAALGGGSSLIIENLFENRFMTAFELMRMGADIRIEGHNAFVTGVPALSGAPVQAPDLRGGAALVIAGLAADGYTEVSAIEHIQRGYEGLVEKLQAVGAHIEQA
jgi:UDP-N-acetylglucosamine 1-carboxyvinyltransferase